MEEYALDNAMKNDYEDYLYLESLSEPYIPDKNLKKAMHNALRQSTNTEKLTALQDLIYKVEHEELGSPPPSKYREKLLEKLYNSQAQLYIAQNNTTNTESVATGDPSNIESVRSEKRRTRRNRKLRRRKTRRTAGCRSY
jgi:hypothetical protein